MVTVKLARTEPINPPSAEPVLTIDQVFKGLVRKCYRPQEFVPLMEGCDILNEQSNGLTRMLTFKQGWGPPGGKAEEFITWLEPLRVDFHIPASGEKVSNIISADTRDPQALYMTFTLEWPHPPIQAGSKEEQDKYDMCDGVCKQIISTTIATIRDMVKVGTIV